MMAPKISAVGLLATKFPYVDDALCEQNQTRSGDSETLTHNDTTKRTRTCMLAVNPAKPTGVEFTIHPQPPWYVAPLQFVEPVDTLLPNTDSPLKNDMDPPETSTFAQDPELGMFAPIEYPDS